MGNSVRQKNIHLHNHIFVAFIRTLIVICVIGIVLSAFLLIYDDSEYAKGKAAYKQVRSVLRYENTETKNQIDVQASSEPLKIDFVSLKRINEDVAGWILNEGAVINYPVVWGTDNEYYLTHMFNHERNKVGSIFIDYRNQNDFSDKNTVIYGHNMKDGSMFSSLTQYKDQSYYDKFPTMMLYTPDRDFKIEFFAGIIADGNYEFIRFKFNNDKDFLDYIDTLKKRSTFISNTSIKSDDRIVTLCTCSYEYRNARYALFGKLTPIKQ